MRETTNRPICHRADDMVAFLYGEASPAEAEDFANHLPLCAACRTEFAVFNQVRESMSQWRAEVLGIAGRPEPVAEPESLPAFVSEGPGKRLSAVAALREFFAISPIWLRGATAMATLLFCVLAALFVTRMLQAPQQLYTQQELNAQVQNRLEQITRERDRTALAANGGNSVQVVPASNPSRPGPGSLPVAPVKQTSATRSSRRFLSRAEREQLAADLRLKPGTDEEDLAFLLDGGSN